MHSLEACLMSKTLPFVTLAHILLEALNSSKHNILPRNDEFMKPERVET